MGATRTQVTNLLEMRFDYQSARNVFNNWRKSAQIKEDVDTLDDAQLSSLLTFLKETAPDAGRVHGAIERLILSPETAPVMVQPESEAAVLEVSETVLDPAPEEAVMEAGVLEDMFAGASDAEQPEAVAEEGNAVEEGNAGMSENGVGRKNKKKKH